MLANNLTSSRKIAVLGCSGSIGKQALDVVRSYPDHLKIAALSVHSHTEELVRAAWEFCPSLVAVTDPAHAHDSILQELPVDCELLVGSAALTDIAQASEVDIVVSAVVGFAGLEAGLAAAKAHKRLAYANKESIVVAGDLIMPLLAPDQLIPVDSEHSAIFQCLVGESHAHLRRIWLTCSGGPFFGKKLEELYGVTAEQALAHPTWKMGAKITIDSATLMNKGLEVIEACQLFGVKAEQIEVLIQRESKIHSMVEFCDGSLKAQLGTSDMRLPIQYALSYPQRWERDAAEVLDWRSLTGLSFAAADMQSFPCLRLAYEAARLGRTAPCVLNASNEVANAAFRAGELHFTDIANCCEEVLYQHSPEKLESLEQLKDLDRWARHKAQRFLMAHPWH